MAQILLTALPESLRALYTQLRLFLGWTYKDIWEAIIKPMKDVSRRMYRKQWRKSQPPQKKSLESYELWVLEWTLFAQQAAPVTRLEAREAFTDELHRHEGYQDELDELYKYEELKGVELSHQGAHQLIQYELTWRSNRDVVIEADKGETDTELRQMRGTGTERIKGNRSGSAPIDFSKVLADACLYCGNKGHRAADCRIKQTDMKNGAPGKMQKQWPRKPGNGDRISAGRGDNRYGNGSNKNGEKGTKGGGRQQNRRRAGKGTPKIGAKQGRSWALEKAAAEAQARLEEGLCVSCGVSGHRFSQCPKRGSGSGSGPRPAGTRGQWSRGGGSGNPQPPAVKPEPGTRPSQA